MTIKQALLLSLGLLPSCFLSAQFSADFTTAEGYSSGTLGSNADWSVFDGSGSDPNTFTVDASGPGNLAIDPSQSGFQAAEYIGSGTPLTENNYLGVMSFSLDYTPGSSATIAGSVPVLPQVQYAVIGGSEAINFGVRQVTGTNTFNIFIVDTFNGSNQAVFSTTLSGTDIGLSIDGSDNWLDGQSDALSLTFDAVYLGSDMWQQTTTLTNTNTSTVVTSTTQTTTDTDGSFAAANQRFRIIPSNMNLYDVTSNVDSVSVAIPEPSTYALIFGAGALGLIIARRNRNT